MPSHHESDSKPTAPRRRTRGSLARLGTAVTLAIASIVVGAEGTPRHLAAIATIAGSAPAVQPPSGRTNIVYIMVDDLGFTDLGPALMPRSTALMTALGTQLRFYSFQGCSPTRSALMTGHEPADVGVTGVDSPPKYDGLDPALILFPERLQDAGYRTGMFGKWHLGLDPAQSPLMNGFDEFVGLAHGWINYYGPRPDREPYPDGSLGHDHQTIHDLQYGGRPLYDSTYSTFLFADAAERFVRAAVDKSKPFFAYLPLNAPHGPNSAPREYVDMYAAQRGVTEAQLAELAKYEGGVLGIPWDSTIDDATRTELRNLLNDASVRALDDAVADLYAVLVEEGIADDTLFMFASDNGAAGSSGRNGDLRGGKGGPWEGGHRVANFLIWPDQIAPGHDVGINVGVVDLYETFLAVAGASLNDPALASNDVLDPLLSGASEFQRKHGGQHLVTHQSKNLHRESDIVRAIWAINEGSLKYFRDVWFDPDTGAVVSWHDEFYDLATDPGETTNLVTDPPTPELVRLRQLYATEAGDEVLRGWHTTESGWGGFERPEEWGFGTRVFAPGEKEQTILVADGAGSGYQTADIAPIDGGHSVTFHHPEAATRLRVNFGGGGRYNRPGSNAWSGTGYTLELWRGRTHWPWNARLWVNDGHGNSRVVAAKGRVAWAKSTALTLDVAIFPDGISGTVRPAGRPVNVLTAPETSYDGAWLGVEARQTGHGAFVTLAF